MSDSLGLDLITLSERLRRHEVSALDVMEVCLARIDRFDPSINAFRHVFKKEACEQAELCDGSRPLEGIPVAVKDNIDVAGQVTRSGLGPRGEKMAERDADIVERLRAAGAVILGHLSMHEGALGATTDNPHYGKTHNPWRPGFTPGGSSGGAGAAIAARYCPLALGTDTLGSVRLPAAYCGVVGFKPTNGLLSNVGIEPLCEELDQVGPLARSVAGIRLLMEALNSSWRSPEGIDLKAVRFARLAEFDKVALTAKVHDAFEDALERLSRCGVPVSISKLGGYDPDKARRAGLLLAEAEASKHYAEDRRLFPDALSPSFAALLDYGAKAERTRLCDAANVFEYVKDGFDFLFEGIDILIAPTAPQQAFAFDEEAPANQAVLTALANIAGAPAISLPIKSTDLPVGLQLIGRRGADAMLLAVAEEIEDLLEFQLPDLPQENAK